MNKIRRAWINRMLSVVDIAYMSVTDAISSPITFHIDL